MEEKEILNVTRIGNQLELIVRQGVSVKEVLESVMLIMNCVCKNPDFEINADTPEKINEIFDGMKNNYIMQEIIKK